MKIDSHQHFWYYNTKDYGWISDHQENLKKDFLPSDLAPLLESNQFDGSIVVQARQSIEETEWLLQLADQYPFIKGVVGWVDLCSSKIEYQLNRFAKYPTFKGVRHVIHDEPNDQFMLREDFLNGVNMLEKYGLTYDLLLFPKHIPYAIELVKRFPNQPFVLDHIGKPNIANRMIYPWKEDIYKLANYENVFCKVSGMVTEANLENWTEEDFKLYLDVIFEAFGVRRIMIGSDWPVCLLSRDYNSVMRIVKNYIKGFPQKDQNKILGENCAEFYKVTY